MWVKITEKKRDIYFVAIRRKISETYIVCIEKISSILISFLMSDRC